MHWRVYHFVKQLLQATCCLAFLVAANCSRRATPAPILLFRGDGTSQNDVAAIEVILRDNHMVYDLANTRQLNTFDTAELQQYKLLIVPGGNFIEMGKSLSPAAVRNVGTAVYKGMNYLGICAGSFLAGDTRNNSFNITGSSFKFYQAAEQGVRKMAVRIQHADSSSTDEYWEDGPQLNGWGETVSKYPDGSTATAQGTYGEGWVLLTGIHPEAPASWRTPLHFSTSIQQSHQYAATLIEAALRRTRMHHF